MAALLIGFVLLQNNSTLRHGLVSFFDVAENRSFDYRQVLHTKRHPNPNSDIVILAIDIKIADRDRFEGKRIIQVSTDVAIKSPNKLIEKAKQVVEAA